MPYKDPEKRLQRQRELNRAKREADPDGVKEYYRKYREGNKDRISKSIKDWHRKNPEAQKDYMLRHEFGITLDDYREILAKQGGACAICGGPPSGRSKKYYHVDHDHKTGRIRGLLCHACNVGIGHLGDTEAGLMRAVEYLRRAA